MNRQIPNALTVLRVLSIPVLLWSYLAPLEKGWLPVLLFLAIGLTDWLDGFLARRWQVESKFGAFLDPAADKLLVVSILVVLVGEQNTLYFTIPALLVIFRELLMSMMREFIAKTNMPDVLAVDKWGKYKTTSQMLSLGFFLVPSAWGQYPAYVLFYLSTALTCMSLCRYVLKLVEAPKPKHAGVV